MNDLQVGARGGDLLEAIVRTTDDAVISKDLDGIIQSWNLAAQRIFGYSAEEAIGQPVTMLLPPERVGEEDMIFARIRKGETIESFETTRVTKPGTLVQVVETITPIRNRRGEVVGAAKVARDISERYRREELQAILAAIVESSDDAIVSKDLNGIVQSWNRGAERLFGYMAEEMIGQPIICLLPPERKQEEARILSRLRRGERIDHFETVRLHRDGRLLDVSVTISPITDSSGAIVGASKVARDIGDRKVLEATMLRLKEELEERVRERTSALEIAHQEMESFTQTIAHDLRTPLRAVASTSTMLERDYSELLPAEAQLLLGRQVSSAKRLTQLVDDLLLYVRIGQNAMKVEWVDLSRLALDVASELKSVHAACKVSVQEGLGLEADKGLLRILMQNLIDNACKFSQGEGEVEVGKRGSAFFVRDEGVGFDMAHAGRIFQPFERLVSDDSTPGTGIGLANVRRIVQKHGGNIWVNSIPGQGTTFFFNL